MLHGGGGGGGSEKGQKSVKYYLNGALWACDLSTLGTSIKDEVIGARICFERAINWIWNDSFWEWERLSLFLPQLVLGRVYD